MLRYHNAASFKWLRNVKRVAKLNLPSLRSFSSLVPKDDHLGIAIPPEIEGHFKWIVQKSRMNQDIILLGLPSSMRRRIVMALAKSEGWEIEYLAITKDTTESDLKQRREIIGDSAIYSDQAPVRAAIHGRVLVLDGIENAERNVLPTLNNLLENREMALDDGRFLMKKPHDVEFSSPDIGNKLVFVNDKFRVIALGLPVPPYAGRSLDPPLRSRFQCRFIDEPSAEGLLSTADLSGVSKEKVQALVTFYESLRGLRESALADDVSLSGLPVYSQDAFLQSIALLSRFPDMNPLEAVSRFVPTVSWLRYILPDRFQYPMESASAALSSLSGQNQTLALKSYAILQCASARSQTTLTFASLAGSNGTVNVHAVAGSDEEISVDFRSMGCSKQGRQLLPFQMNVLSSALMDHSIGQHICILGPKGSGKSVIAREFSRAVGYKKLRVFPLYQELTSRDLLQRRITDDKGNTTWSDSPLIRSAREGSLCVLDGIHSLDIHALGSLRRLLQDGVVDLPNGERLNMLSSHEIAAGSTGIHPAFRVIALGLNPPKPGGDSSRSTDSRLRYISSDLGFTFHSLPKGTPQDIAKVLSLSIEAGAENNLQTKVADMLSKALSALSDVAGDKYPELQPSFRHALNIKSALTLHDDHRAIEIELRRALENTFLIRYMPGLVAEHFESAMESVGLGVKSLALEADERRDVELNLTDTTLTIGSVAVTRSVPESIEKVPRPLFFDNMAHRHVLQSMLGTHVSNRYNATLLIGNQGVGKNKLVDHMLALLRREREYIQLHRDTTVQSLTVLPSLQDGKIIYEDSPLLRAAKFGRVLVVDEADKAPVEVLCLLKMLAEDGELVLYDGRRLLSRERIVQEFPPSLNGSCTIPNEVIPIDERFRLVVLANRPGFPFHGNNLFRECGDVFSIHVVENLDLRSEINLLQAYGPDVPVDIINRIAHAFKDLRRAYEDQEMSYPYSAREAVAVVKHVQAYPEDGVAAAVENIIGFEGYNPRIRKQIALIFQSKGIPVPIQPRLGASGDPLTHRESVLANIILAPSRPVPAPMSYPVKIKREEQIKCDVDVNRLPLQDWTSNVHKVYSFDMEQARLFSFSEEMGRIYVGDRCKTFHSERVMGMVADEQRPDVLHVLSNYPLELHTLYPDDQKLGYSSAAGGKCVTRSLIDPDIHWRMGDPYGILGTLPGGGVAVYLPDFAMALIAPPSGNVDDVKPVLQVALPSIVPPGKSGKKQSMLDRLLASFSGVGNNAISDSTQAQKDQLRCLYKQESDTVHLVDYSALKCLTVKIPGGGIRSVRQVGGCNDQWIVSTHTGNSASLQQYLLTVSLSSDSAICFPLEVAASIGGNSATDAAPAWDDHHYDSWKTDADVSSFKPSTASWGASPTAHYGELDMSPLTATASGSLAIWPRSESVGNNMSSSITEAASNLLSRSPGHGAAKDVVIPSTNTASDISVNASVRASRGKKGASNPTSVLEVLDLTSQSLKELDLTSALKTPEALADSRPGQAVSVALLQSGVEGGRLTAVLDSQGCIRLFETDDASLAVSRKNWAEIMGAGERQSADYGSLHGHKPEEGTSKPRFGVDKPKHGKEDPNNDPHVGGNTWAGGTGGSDTAGMGGRGGPYRLDKGHKVHQVSDKDRQISAEARARAAQMGKEAFEQRMKDINMGKAEFQSYERFRNAVQQHSNQLRLIMEEMTTRAKERVWLRNQNQGELDDAKLVDGLTGDRLVFKRRGFADKADDSADGTGAIVKKRLQFVMDVSGSMYRFNGEDRRLERMLEAALLIMTAMPSLPSEGGEKKRDDESSFEYAITGHSGDSDDLTFVPFGSYGEIKDEKGRLKILQKMVAHSQFCLSGDNTLEAANKAVKTIVNTDDSGSEEAQYQRYVFVLSDANFERYGITASDIRLVMHKDPRVQVHFILIATLGDEAERLAASLPGGRLHMCYESADLPAIFKKILTSYGGALDTN